MNRVSLAGLLLGAWVPSLLHGQDATVRGRVTSRDGNRPVPLAELAAGSRRAFADSSGEFVLGGLTAGDVRISVRRIGYAPATFSLMLSPGEVREVQVELEPAITRLDPLVTVAGRQEQRLVGIAAAVSVADSVAIRADRTVGLNETLRMLPGVQATSRYGTDDVNIGIRGSASRNPQAIRGVAVLLDGVPLTEPDGRTRADQVELAAARQVEVVRGPKSALFAGSAGGVINIVSQNGRDSRGVQARAQGGSFGFRKVDGSAGTPLGRRDQGSVFASGSYTAIDGYRQHSVSRVARGLFRSDWQPSAGSMVTLEGDLSSLDTENPGALTQAEADANPDSARADAALLDFHRKDTRWRVGVRGRQALGASGGPEVTGYFFYGGRTLDFTPPFDQPALFVIGNLHRTQVGARVVSAGAEASSVRLVAGVDYDNLYGADRRYANVAGMRGVLLDDGYFSTPNLGLYTEAGVDLDEAWSLQAGVRRDQVWYRFQSIFPGQVPAQDTSYAQVSPRVTAAWRPEGTSSVYLSVARGFETPLIAELVNSPGTPLRPVSPKSLWNYEVGGRTMVGGELLLDASAFYADVRGEFVPASSGGTSEVENAARSRNLGLEVAATALVTPWLDLSANYAYLDAKLLDYEGTVTNASGGEDTVSFAGRRLPAVPRHRIAAEARLRPVHSVNAGIQVEWQDRMFVETGNASEGTWYYVREGAVIGVPFRAVPARVLVHLNASWQVGSVALFGNIQNVFGKRVTANVTANDFEGRFYDPGPGRVGALGVALTPGH